MEFKRNNRLIVKIVLDIVMALLLVLLYNKRTISMSFHEVGGLCVFGLFLIHKALNWRWIKGVTTKLFCKGTQNRLRIAWIVDALLLLVMIILIVTGLMISKTLPITLPGGHGASRWHYFAAAWSIILVGIHLGLHWNFIRGMGKKVNILPKKVTKVLGGILLTATLLFGGFSLVTGSFSRWMTAPFLMGNIPMERPNENNWNNNSNESDPNENGSNKDNSNNEFHNDDSMENNSGNDESDMEKPGSVPEGETLMYGGQETGESFDFGQGKGRNGMNGNGNRGEYEGSDIQGKNGPGNVNGKQHFSQGIGFPGILLVILTYGSEILLFAFFTVVIEKIVKRNIRKL